LDSSDKDTYWFKGSIYIICILIMGISTFTINKCSQTEPNVTIIYDHIVSTSFNNEYTGPLYVAYIDDQKINAIIFRMHNEGNKPSTNFVFSFKADRSDIQPKITWEPEIISKNVIDRDDSTLPFKLYRKISPLPIEAKVLVELSAERPFKDGDVTCAFVDDHKVWHPQKGKITIYRARAGTLSLLTPIAYAIETKSNSTLDKKDDRPKSGILIGGYDPLILTNGLFSLLQKKRIISKTEAHEIKRVVEDTKEGVLFGGINILKFNELVLNTLIKNKTLEVREAEHILRKSREAGGVLVGGYNIIVLEVEILNALLLKQHISKEEGQEIIDSARQKKSQSS